MRDDGGENGGVSWSRTGEAVTADAARAGLSRVGLHPGCVQEEAIREVGGREGRPPGLHWGAAGHAV